MIRVTVELVSARTGKVEVLGRAIIANDGTGGEYEASYDARFEKRRGGHVWKRGRVEGFKRKSAGVWELLALALNDAIPDLIAKARRARR